jgi:hypothetical protein
LIAIGRFVGSADTERFDDPYDVAVCRLPPEIVEELAAVRFLRIRGVDFADPGPKAVFSLLGFPGMWSRPTRSKNERLSVRPFEFTTYAYDGDTKALTTYRPRLHLLLSADSCQRRSKIRQFRRLKIRQFGEGTSLSSSRPPDGCGVVAADQPPDPPWCAAPARAPCVGACGSYSRGSSRCGSGGRADR